MSTQEAFVRMVDLFLQESGLTPTQFGAHALGDSAFVIQIRAGRSPRLELVDRVIAFMAKWREDAAAGRTLATRRRATSRTAEADLMKSLAP